MTDTNAHLVTAEDGDDLDYIDDEDLEDVSDEFGEDFDKDRKDQGNAPSSMLLPQTDKVKKTNFRSSREELQVSLVVLDQDTNCGIGRCRPNWLNVFNHFEVFIVLLSLSGICMGIQNSLKSAAITRLEKRFTWDSKTVSMVTTSNDMVFLPSVLLVSYFGSFGHRPRILALSCLGNAVAAFVFALPYFLYGALLKDGPLSVERKSWHDQFGYHCPANSSSNSSQLATLVSDQESYVSLALFMISGFLEGISAAPYWNLGVAFIDDITGDMSGVFVGLMISARILSPSIGYLLYGKVLMKIPENLKNYFHEYPLKLGDPSYIPAWWLGFILVGFIGLVISIPMSFFPRMPYFNPKTYQGKDGKERGFFSCIKRFNKRQKQEAIKSGNAKLEIRSREQFSLQGFFASLCRIFRNPIYICLLIGNLFEFMELNAVIAYFSKYLENQYHVSTGEASTLTGVALPGCNAFGILISSFVASQVVMTVPQLARYHAIVNVFGIFGSLTGFFFACNPVVIESIPPATGGVIFPSTCLNGSSVPGIPSNCLSCNRMSFQPSCISNKTFYNPCAAGCYLTGPNVTCPCQNSTFSKQSFSTDRTCESLCSSVYPFIALYSLLKLVRISARSQEAVLQMRCVKPQDKALGLGFNSFAFSINGIWVPIFVGALFDKACLIFNPKAASTSKGNCLFYDTDRFRYSFIGFITTAQIPACIFFIAAWYCTRRYSHLFQTAPTEGDNNLELQTKEDT